MTDSEKLDLVLTKLDFLENDTQELKQRTINVESKVTNIELTLENEIRTNIQRVTVLETELRRIKERIEGIA